MLGFTLVHPSLRQWVEEDTREALRPVIRLLLGG